MGFFKNMVKAALEEDGREERRRRNGQPQLPVTLWKE